jgi:hypothetical protein
VKDKDDGSFWIEFSDYIKYFLCTEFCFVSSPFFTQSVKLNETFGNGGNPDELAFQTELILYSETEVKITGVMPFWRFFISVGTNSNKFLT